jgi:hypothetical protein
MVPGRRHECRRGTHECARHKRRGNCGCDTSLWKGPELRTGRKKGTDSSVHGVGVWRAFQEDRGAWDREVCPHFSRSCDPRRFNAELF